MNFNTGSETNQLSIKDYKTPSTPHFSKHGHRAATEPQSRKTSFPFTLKCVLVCFASVFFVFAGIAHAQQTVTCDTHTPSDPPTNKDALIALYCATDGENWTSSRSRHWLTDMELNAWAGVTAGDPDPVNNPTPNDNSDDIVTMLLITRGYLHGEIPPEIGNLTRLEILNLSSNYRSGTQTRTERSLSGPIPREIGNLSNLTELILFNNPRLSRPIPPELGNLTNLTKLELHNNNLSGPIPRELGKLGSLTRLTLDRNKLSGPIPRELGKLGSLTRLTLDRNKLSGPIPPELGNLGNPDPSDSNSSSSLDRLELSRNSLSGPIPPELGNLDGATNVYLFDNQLSGPIPPELGNLSSVGGLWINNNQLTGPLPVELFTMAALNTLDLRNNRIDGEIPAPPDSGAEPELSQLYLQNNQLSGPIPPQFKNLVKLRSVNLDYNQLSGPIPTELNSMNLQHLSQLRLRGNQLTGTIPSELGNLHPETIDRLSTDVVIDLSRNQLTGDIPVEFWEEKIGSSMTYIKELYLNDNQLTWSTLPTQAQLEGLTKLERLYLQNNILTGEIPVAGLEALTVDDSDPPEPTATFRELALWGNEGLELSTAMSDELVKRVDRAALRLLYEGADGPNWTRVLSSVDGSSFRGYYSWFGAFGGERDAPPTPFNAPHRDPIFEFWRLPGVTVNGDGHVASLDLSSNNLVGVIDNVAFEQLGGLQTLNLSGNRSLRGTLPVGLVDLRALQTVNVQCTGINTPTDPDFQAWLRTTNFTGSRCPSFRSPTPPPPPPPPPPPAPPEDMEELKVFYLETGGENWTDNTNWLNEDESLSQRYGVTVNNEERVTALDLSGNGLSGSVPPLLGHLVSELETLNLADNPMLTGMLPLSLMNLSELETLNIEGTGACAPEDAEFQQWLGTIDFQGDVCVTEVMGEEMIEEMEEGACVIAGTGNTPENAVFNLLLIIFALTAVSWKSSSGVRRTQFPG